MKFTKLVVALIILLQTTAFSQDKPVKNRILPQRPIDIGNLKTRNLSLIAIIDQLVRFRLEPIKEISTVSEHQLLPLNAAFSNYATIIDNSTYNAISTKVAATHLLTQQFELSVKDKKIHYYIEIITPNRKEVVISKECDLPIDNYAPGIDSVLLTILKEFEPKISPETERFFEIPVLSNNIKTIKQFGELLLLQKNGLEPDNALLAREYEKLIEKDPLLLLANYVSAPIFYKTKQYTKTSRYIKELLDIIPIHTSLYLPLAQSYRLAGQYQDALNVTLTCERIRIRSIPLLLEKAFSFEGMNQRGNALSTYQQILSLNPNEPQSLLFMARRKNDDASFKEALAFAEKLISIEPQNGMAFYEKGRALSALGKADDAFAAFKVAEKINPGNPKILEWLGDMCMRKQLYPDAVTSFQKALSSNKLDFSLFLKTVKALQMNNKDKEALALLKDNALTFQSKPLLHKETGLLEFKTGNIDASLNALKIFLQTDSTDGDALLVLGHIYNRKSNFQSALQFYEAALKNSENKEQCKLAVADVKIKTGHQVEAQKILNEIIAVKPLKTAYRLMGDALVLAGDQRGALTNYKKERELHGDDPYVQEKIALLHYEQGFFAPAKTEFFHLIELSPKHVAAHYYLAILSLREGQIAVAEQMLKKAQLLGDATAPIYLNLGINLANNNLLDKSIDAFKKCVSLEPSNQNALTNLADVYLKAKKDSSAAETYVVLFNLDNKKYAPQLASAGHIFNALKLQNKAIQIYSLFLDKGYSDFDVNANYATIMYSKKDYQKVISLLKNINGKWTKDEQLLIKLSDSYFNLNQYAAALPWLTATLSINQNNKFAVKLSAISFEKSGDTLKAISMYERYIEFSHDQEYNNHAFHLGELYEKKGMTDKAVAQYESNMKDKPDDLRNHLQLSAIHINAKKLEQARLILEKAAEFPHFTPQLEKMLAQTYALQNNATKAISIYESYLKKVPDDAAAWKELGECFYSLKNFNKAIGPFTKVIELKKESFDVFYNLGICYLETENFSKATAPLAHARALKKQDTRVFEASARCYRSLKETSTLTSVLNEWISFDPKRYDIKIELGALLLDQKKIAEAITMLNDAAVFIPTEPKPHILLAFAYEIQGNDSLRLQHLNTSLKFSPQSWETHYQLARYYLSNNTLGEAEKHLVLSIKYNPGHGLSHFEYASILLEKKEFKAAGIEFETALEIEPNNPLFLALNAFSSVVNGNQKRGQDHITIALGKGPSDPRILYWAGMIAKQSGKTEAARRYFNEALTFDNSNIMCMEALGDISMEEIRFKTAASHYFQCWEKGGFNERRAFKLGNALAYDQKYLAAKDFYETIISRNPGHSEALFRLTNVYCELNDLKSARKNISLFKSDGTPWMQLAQGIIYEKENNLEAATVAYTIAKRISPDNSFVHSGFGRISLKGKSFDAAIIELSSAAAADTFNMQLLIDLGSAFMNSGDTTSAFYYYSDVDKKYPEHTDVHELMARIKDKEGKHNEAAKICERGLTYHPANPELHFLLGCQYKETEKYENAITAFQAALKNGKGQPIEAFKNIGNIYYNNMINNKKAKEFYKRYVKAGGNSVEVAEAIRKLDGN